MKSTIEHCLRIALLLMYLGNTGAIAEVTGVAAQAKAMVTYLPGDEDRAGSWQVFGKGNARITGDPSDWHLQLKIDAPVGTLITALTFLHNQVGYPEEGWSTASANVFQKTPYPLVVVDSNDKQLNTAYDQVLPALTAAHTVLDLFLQRENPFFGGGVLIIKFGDGSSLSLDATAGAVPMCPGETSAPQANANFSDLASPATCQRMLDSSRNEIALLKKKLRRAQLRK